MTASSAPASTRSPSAMCEAAHDAGVRRPHGVLHLHRLQNRTTCPFSTGSPGESAAAARGRASGRAGPRRARKRARASRGALEHEGVPSHPDQGSSAVSDEGHAVPAPLEKENEIAQGAPAGQSLEGDRLPVEQAGAFVVDTHVANLPAARRLHGRGPPTGWRRPTDRRLGRLASARQQGSASSPRTLAVASAGDGPGRVGHLPAAPAREPADELRCRTGRTRSPARPGPPPAAEGSSRRRARPTPRALAAPARSPRRGCRRLTTSLASSGSNSTPTAEPSSTPASTRTPGPRGSSYARSRPGARQELLGVFGVEPQLDRMAPRRRAPPRSSRRQLPARGDLDLRPHEVDARASPP